MGIFQKVSSWLSEKSDRLIRGSADHESGYYASQDAQDAYSGVTIEDEMSQSVGEATGRREPLDPFGRGEGEYGGRVPYRSKRDLEMEAYQQQQAAYEQQKQAAAQAAAQQRAQAQQPVQQAAPAQQQAQAPNGYAQGYGAVNGNVVMFPGMQQNPEGMAYTHVEYVVLLRSRNECKNVIGYIKTNASVFLNMEFIASDSERQRCVDMLSGAAYTLGCALNKISPRGIYLISAPTVKVVLDSAMQKAAAAPEAQGYARQRYEQEGYSSGYAQPQQSQHPAAGYQQQTQPSGSYQQQPQNYQPSQQPAYEAPAPQQPAPRTFSTESPTARFFAQGTQRNHPISMASAVAGSFTGSYAATGTAGQTSGRYRAVEYPQ